MQYISIIIPTYNEALSIKTILTSLSPLIQDGHEVIIVDGGSEDETISLCKHYTDKVFVAKKGRSFQMNFGAKQAANEILVFLHADTVLPSNAVFLITNALSSSSKQWGHFKVKLKGEKFILRIIEFFMNKRSCLTGIVTGDQTIFISKKLFVLVNGYKSIPLMEDIELSKTLKKYSTPICIDSKVISSSRRWEANGYLRTIFLMWKLRLLYFFGVPANKLVNYYYK